MANGNVVIRPYASTDEAALVRVWNRAMWCDPISVETWRARVLLDPNFAPDIADDVHRLAQRASQVGLHPLALKLVSGFHKRWPKHQDIARNYLFAAKLMTDKLNREDQALQLLTQLKAFRPDDVLMPEIDAQIQLLQSLVRTTRSA